MEKNASAASALEQWYREVRTSPLLLAWDLSALGAVLLPLILFIVSRAGFDRDGNVDNNDEQSLGALVLAYVLSLLMFFVFVYFGHVHIRRPQESKLFPMILVMFAGWSLIAGIIAACGIRALDGKEWDERPWRTHFPSCMVVTYWLWALLGFFFAAILYAMARKKDKNMDDTYHKVAEDDDFESGCGWCVVSEKD